MDAERFVDLVRVRVRDGAIRGTLKTVATPPGRKVSELRRTRSTWFNGLAETEAVLVRSIVHDAVDQAIFDLLAVLDGSRVIADGRFELAHLGDARVVLNDPEQIGLKELYTAVD